MVVIFAVIRAFMQLFDPRVHLRLKPGALKPGRDCTLEWSIPGGRERLAQLRITLECREEARYRSGKDDQTATAVCYRSELVNVQERTALAAGSVDLKLPNGLMHSLNTGRNKIVWTMRVEGKIPRWAGVKDEYPVTMLPECLKEEAI